MDLPAMSIASRNDAMLRVVGVLIGLVAWQAQGALSAAELVIRDLDLDTQLQPSGYQYDLHSSTFSANGRDGFSSATQEGIGGRFSFTRPGDALGPVAGIDMLLDNADGVTSSLYAAQIHASLGLYYAISDRWVSGVEVGGGWGLSRLNLQGNASFPTFVSNGTVLGYDARVLVSYQALANWRFGVFAGYTQERYHFSHDEVDLTLNQHGVMAGLELSYILSSAPVRLK
jgi:hypothetical protein